MPVQLLEPEAVLDAARIMGRRPRRPETDIGAVLADAMTLQGADVDWIGAYGEDALQWGVRACLRAIDRTHADYVRAAGDAAESAARAPVPPPPLPAYPWQTDVLVPGRRLAPGERIEHVEEVWVWEPADNAPAIADASPQAAVEPAAIPEIRAAAERRARVLLAYHFPQGHRDACHAAREWADDPAWGMRGVNRALNALILHGYGRSAPARFALTLIARRALPQDVLNQMRGTYAGNTQLDYRPRFVDAVTEIRVYATLTGRLPPLPDDDRG